MLPPKRIGIALSSRENAQAVFKGCIKAIKKSGVAAEITKNLEPENLEKNKAFQESSIIICFGGDGSFLKVLHAIKKPIPVFLVGTGERNYLSTISPENAPKIIEAILNGEYRTEKRERLSTNWKEAPLALNEIVVAPTRSATILHYTLAINGKPKWHDYSDGVIACTPTGSSAYFGAAEGPEIETDAEVFGIASLNSVEGRKKLVCSNRKTVAIRNVSALAPVEAIFDGQQRIIFHEDLKIQRASKPAVLGFPLDFSPARATKTVPRTPGSRFILALLQNLGASTQKELAMRSGMHPRTVRRALSLLLQSQLVTKRPYSKDQRQDLYHPIEPTPKR